MLNCLSSHCKFCECAVREEWQQNNKRDLWCVRSIHLLHCKRATETAAVLVVVQNDRMCALCALAVLVLNFMLRQSACIHHFAIYCGPIHRHTANKVCAHSALSARYFPTIDVGLVRVCVCVCARAISISRNEFFSPIFFRIIFESFFFSIFSADGVLWLRRAMHASVRVCACFCAYSHRKLVFFLFRFSQANNLLSIFVAWMHERSSIERTLCDDICKSLSSFYTHIFIFKPFIPSYGSQSPLAGTSSIRRQCSFIVHLRRTIDLNRIERESQTPSGRKKKMAL